MKKKIVITKKLIQELKNHKRECVIWAIDCAQHVLTSFEKEYPKDNRPRKAIETGKAWLKVKDKSNIGWIKLNEIRAASLAAHAAARNAPENSAARYAARSAGQAVATAHASGHCLGAAYYAVKAAEAAGKSGEQERKWQYKKLPKKLRPLIK